MGAHELIYLDEIFPDPDISIWNLVLPNINRTGPVSGPFNVHVCCYFVVISFFRWCRPVLINIISSTTIKNLALDFKIYPHIEKTTPFRSRPDPFPGSRPSPKLRKIWPCDPNFSGDPPTVRGALLVFNPNHSKTLYSTERSKRVTDFDHWRNRALANTGKRGGQTQSIGLGIKSMGLNLDLL